MKEDYSFLNEVNKQTEQNRNKVTISNISKEIYDRERRKKLFYGGLTLLTTAAMVIGGIKLVQYSKDPETILQRELQIHSGTYSLDGKHVDPNDAHDCAIGGPEEGTIAERFVRYANTNKISYPELVKEIQKYGSSILNENDIHVNPDGSYEVTVQENSYGISK